MGRLDDRTRLVLRRALPAVLIDGDFRAVVRAVFDLGAVTTARSTSSRPPPMSATLLEPLATKPLGEISYGELLGHILRVATAYHVVLPRELVLVVKQLLYFERYAKELAPDYRILGRPRHPRARHRPCPSRSSNDRPCRTRPATRDLDAPGGGLVVTREAEVQFSWVYDRRPDRAHQAVRQGQALAVERHHRHRLVRSTSTRSTPAASPTTCR